VSWSVWATRHSANAYVLTIEQPKSVNSVESALALGAGVLTTCIGAISEIGVGSCRGALARRHSANAYI
jgi:hypothetical protein